MKKNLNQKLINLIEYYTLLNSNLLLSVNEIKRKSDDSPISFTGSKSEKLEKLKKSIELIKKSNKLFFPYSEFHTTLLVLVLLSYFSIVTFFFYSGILQIYHSGD